MLLHSSKNKNDHKLKVDRWKYYFDILSRYRVHYFLEIKHHFHSPQNDSSGELAYA